MNPKEAVEHMFCLEAWAPKEQARPKHFVELVFFVASRLETAQEIVDFLFFGLFV